MRSFLRTGSGGTARVPGTGQQDLLTQIRNFFKL